MTPKEYLKNKMDEQSKGTLLKDIDIFLNGFKANIGRDHTKDNILMNLIEAKFLITKTKRFLKSTL